MWEKDPGGECGMEGDAFYADDTNSKRKIYGKQKLEVKVNGALMTKQMQGNKATKVASLDEALAKQKEVLDKKAALAKAPTNLPFKDWKLPAKELTLEKNQRVWAVAVNREGKWRLAGFRWKETTDGVLWLKGMTDRFAPAAFVHIPTEAAKKGDAVAYVAGRTMYGYVTKVEGDQVTMSYLSGRKVKDKTGKAEMFLGFKKGAFQLGTPVLYKDGDAWQNGEVVVEDGDQVYVLHKKGGEQTVAPMNKADLKLLDGSSKHKKGARVLVKQTSGMGSLKWMPGKVTKVHGGGAAYEVKTDEGKVYTQMWAYVAKP
jgi:hypothetical protein